MRIYIDSDFKCHCTPAEGLRAVDSDFFDNKCRTFVEGYRMVPEGENWTREDGVTFTGEMVTPWMPEVLLAQIQADYDGLRASVQGTLENSYREGVNSI